MSFLEALWLRSEARPVTDLGVGLGGCAGCSAGVDSKSFKDTLLLPPDAVKMQSC